MDLVYYYNWLYSKVFGFKKSKVLNNNKFKWIFVIS